MSNIPAIINTDIINHKWDIYWKDIAGDHNAGPTDNLVISLPVSQNSAEQLQLEKMMGACQLDKSQYTILQIQSGEEIAWHKIKEVFKPKQILLLGVLPMQLGIMASFQLYHPNRFDDRVFIASLSLAEMEQQPESKKRLWIDGLKPVFVDNPTQQ